MKIGIITIHRILNYGSALQAYATIKAIKKMFPNDTVEIIDYVFPNNYHYINRNQYHFIQILKKRIRLYYKIVFEQQKKKEKRFNSFIINNLSLSKQKYQNIDDIYNNVPLYDLYITGSDQVWNWKTLVNDPIMYLDFVPSDKRKISFASSFGLSNMPKEIKPLIKGYLNKYSFISLREKSGLDIISDLNLSPDIEKKVVCDPTLLLDSMDYDSLAAQSQIKLDFKYILVYRLSYAYNPEPAVSILTENVAKKLHCKIIYVGEKDFQYKGEYNRITGIGPCEFVYLFKNAQFVITSSFHGTMFSIIYRKSFYSIIPSTRDNKDSRIGDILNIIGLQSRGIQASSNSPSFSFIDYSKVENLLNMYIKESKEYLEKSIRYDK